MRIYWDEKKYLPFIVLIRIKYNIKNLHIIKTHYKLMNMAIIQSIAMKSEYKLEFLIQF